MEDVNTTSFKKIYETKDIVFINYYKSCFYFDNKEYFFKVNDNQGAILEGELLATKIGEKLGIDVLHVEPAVFVDKSGNEKVGLLSKNFFKDRLSVYFDAKASAEVKKMTYNGIINGVKEFIHRSNKLQPELNIDLESNFYTKLRDMIFFDFLTFQGDRFLRNIDFFMKKNKTCDGWTLCLAPIFDNSWIFCFQEHISGFLPLKPIVSDYISRRHYFITGFKAYQGYDEMKNDVLKYFYRNTRMKKLAVKAYNIDIEECIAEIEKEYPGYIFAPEYKQSAIDCWNFTKQTLKIDFGVENLIKESDDFEK